MCVIVCVCVCMCMYCVYTCMCVHCMCMYVGKCSLHTCIHHNKPPSHLKLNLKHILITCHSMKRYVLHGVAGHQNVLEIDRMKCILDIYICMHIGKCFIPALWCRPQLAASSCFGYHSEAVMSRGIPVSGILVTSPPRCDNQNMRRRPTVDDTTKAVRNILDHIAFCNPQLPQTPLTLCNYS